MTYYYSLTRTLDDGSDGYSTTVSISDRDAVNCGHMIATGFNTMSRNFTLGWVLGLVHPETGEVQYDGKIEQIKRDEPWSVSQTFNFEASTDADTIVTIFDNENGRLMYPGKFKFAETDETTSAVAAETVASTISRKVLESAYVELHRVKDVLFDAGVETIPADAGVTDLRAVLRARDVEISELVQERANKAAEIGALQSEFVQERANANEAARAEQIKRDEPEPSAFAHVARDVLEDAYDEYLLVQAMLSEIGVETIPISAGVDKLREQVSKLTKRNNHEFHARSMYEQVEGQKREAARAELIEYVKRERAIWKAAEEPVNHEHMRAWFRGMLDVLAKFLVVTGEADADEGHAVARRLCGISDE